VHVVDALDGADGTLDQFELHAAGCAFEQNVQRLADYPETRPQNQQADRVCVTLATGRRAEADLLICADGVGSIARARLQPAAQRSYSGYVAWRGTLPESEVSPATYALLGDALTYQVLPGSHILVYPIPGLDGSVRRGERLINMVWYVNVAAGAPLDELMTGRDGVLRPVSLPPGAKSSTCARPPPSMRSPSR